MLNHSYGRFARSVERLRLGFPRPEVRAWSCPVRLLAIALLCVAFSVWSLPSAYARDTFDVSSQGLVLPTAVAPYGKDRYVVADAALQRIFVVGNDGTMTVLAGGGEPNALGSVTGGYADGRGASALFNTPQGITADAKGIVYVADTGNHCIRKITPNGIVSTLAGSPTHVGFRDGPAAIATFRAPRGITLDRNGDLLVADVFVGIRRVTRSGEVHTLPIPVNSPLDVTFLIGADGSTIYVASDIEGLIVGRLGGKFWRYALDNVQASNSAGTIGRTSIGHPYSVAGYGSHRVVFTDRFTSEVRILDINFNFVRVVDPSANGGPSPLSEPLEVRMLQDHQSIAVVDAGHRRVSMVPLDPDRTIFSPGVGSLFPEPPNRSKERIALVGNSTVWWATDWATSIEGRAEAMLNALPRTRPFEVLPVGATAATAAAQLSYVGQLCDAHIANIVALDLNSAVIHDSYSFAGPISSPAAVATWAAPLRAAIEPVAAQCQTAGVRFIITINPLLNEVGSNEDALRRLFENDLGTDPDAHQSYLAALQGLPVIDLWPAFSAAEAADGGDHPALYLLSDAHLSAAGRAVFASAFAEAIERLEPGS